MCSLLKDISTEGLNIPPQGVVHTMFCNYSWCIDKLKVYLILALLPKILRLSDKRIDAYENESRTISCMDKSYSIAWRTIKDNI